MLTYIQINAAKPRAKAWNLSDSQGLYLVIQPNGSKLWRFNYRFLDKQKKLHLGGWPTISLADARVRRDEAKKKIAEGMDPALEKKRARIAAKYAAANTFEAVAEEWLVKCERDGLAPVTVDKIRWLLAKAYPVIGTIPIAQITPHEALAVLRKVEATGAYESARRMRSVLSRVFRYGVATVRCDKDVAADLRGAIAAPKVKHFAAITKPSEVGALLRAIDGYTGHKVTVMAMRLSEQLGKRFEPARIGERVEGVIARRVDLESGPHALVERSRDFTLVPWRDVLDRNIGKTAFGIMRAGGISWQFGRGRSGPTIG
jgi:hypothetical protein